MSSSLSPLSNTEYASYPNNLDLSEERIVIFSFGRNYLPVHISEMGIIPLAKRLDEHFQRAKTVALNSAKEKHIPFDAQSEQPKFPIYTVLKSGKEWFPALALHGSMKIIETLKGTHLGGTQEAAIDNALIFAHENNAQYVPPLKLPKSYTPSMLS